MSSAAAGVRVSDCLLSASDDSLSSSLALLSELSLANLVLSKGTEFLEKLDNKIGKGSWLCDSDHFQEKVVAKSKQFANLSRGERLLLSIGELQQLMKLNARDLKTIFDLSEVADDIGMAAVDLLKQDKGSDFRGADVGAMIEYQLTKVFGGLSVRMEELSATQQQNLVERVREFLSSLPADQQRFIMDKLRASDLSDAAIRNAIANGTIWTAFAAAVQVFGFAFYTTAAHLLAIISLHLLPFGAYVGLSSTIAVLSSPWMLPVFAGFGIWYYRRKNRDLRQSMAPLIVTSLCLSGMEVQARTPSYRQEVSSGALSLWATARGIRDEKRRVKSAAESIRNQALERLTSTRNLLSDARSRRDSATRSREQLDQELSKEVHAAVGDIANGRWSKSFAEAAGKIPKLEAQIFIARQKRDNTKGFLRTIGAHLKYGVDRINLDADLSSAKDRLVQQVKSAWPMAASSYPANAQDLLRDADAKASEIISLEAEIERLRAQEHNHSKQLDDANEKVAEAQRAQETSEQRYYGLGVV